MPGDCTQLHWLSLVRTWSHDHTKCKEELWKICSLFWASMCSPKFQKFHYWGRKKERKDIKINYINYSLCHRNHWKNCSRSKPWSDFQFWEEKNHSVYNRGNGYRWGRLESGQLRSEFSSPGDGGIDGYTRAAGVSWREMGWFWECFGGKIHRICSWITCGGKGKRNPWQPR